MTSSVPEPRHLRPVYTSEELPPPAPEPEPREQPRAVGTWLREMREYRGLTLAEVSNDTRIGVVYLEALEAERWDVLPAPVYARGFLRSYARYLDIDPDAAVAMIPSDLPRPPGLDPAPGLRRRPQPSPKMRLSLPALALPSLRPRLPSTTRTRPLRTSRVDAAPNLRRTPVTGSPPGNALARLTGGNVRSLGIAGVALLLLGAAGFATMQLGGEDASTATTTPSDATSAVGTNTSIATPPAGALAGSEPTADAGPVASVAAPPPAIVVREGEMPDLAGATRRDAEDAMGRLDLNYVVIEVVSDAAPPGTVYSQNPEPGKPIQRGSSATVVVARERP